ncbi:MAG: hypothetical protein H6662_10360 [Ardenticatenaceae bacterium]|nr:hypothetical protein [Anaerolineales bacterium]MCB8921976.1 hypothetical protein [Ardenticatenaceae bacterium]MCB8989552.1 hypothetical protein [Ardenticatenaceae bacterium]MCB9003095.1 hypothetical protein [Ardenticatenaceae bacterium]
MNGTSEVFAQKRQRLAWFVLFGGFVVFIAIAIAIPWLTIAYVQDTTDLLPVLAQSNQGTVSIDSAVGPPRAALPGEAPQAVNPGETVLTDATATGLLLVYPAENTTEALARLQLYGTTSVRITTAEAPRFESSDKPLSFAATLTGGRIRLVVADVGERPYLIILNTPHGIVYVREPGEYSLDVNNEMTQVTVQQGSLDVRAQGESLILNSTQRAEIALNAAPAGPLPPERDLVQNGSFRDRWSRWVQLAWTVERSDQPVGQIDIAEIFGEAGLQITRTGEGHADVGVRQLINQDVTDFEMLLLEINLRIRDQSLGVCGTVGSECPVIVRIDYDDVDGNPQVWQQGFYASGEIGPDGPPDVCVSCPPPRFEHYQVPLGQLFLFQADLISELQRKGFLPPRRIKSISVMASGHSFAVEILDISLLAEEQLVE